MTNTNKTYCIECKKEIGHTTQNCPHCGSSFPHGVAFHCTFFGLLCLGVAFFFCTPFSGYFFGFLSVGTISLFLAYQTNEGKKRIYAEAENLQPPHGLEEDQTSDRQQPKKSYRDQETYTPPPVEHYWNDPRQVRVHANFLIEYTDRYGDKSSREIEISSYDGSAYLNAFCHHRNEPRMFRIDRIDSCVDATTGEVIQDLPQYLLEKYEKSAQFLFESKGYIQDPIKILHYVGKADSQLRKEERAIIYHVFRQISKQSNITDEEIAKVINQIQTMSPQAFKLAVGRVAKNKIELLTYTLKAAEKIVHTQKKIHPNEQEALDYMAKKIAMTQEQN